MPLGAHLPTSKGLAAALRHAQELGCDCLQIFSKSPRQWDAVPLDPGKTAAFRAAWEASGCAPLVAHDSYLINLAAPDDTVREHSIRALQDEVERADALGCDFLVTHCGAHLQRAAPAQRAGGAAKRTPPQPIAASPCLSTSASQEAGLDRLIASLREVLEATPGVRVRIALENTAAQGTCLGGSFEHLSRVLDEIGGDRLRVCFDTCHAFAAGHDVATPHGLTSTLRALDAAVGLDRLALLHLNDSKGALGGRLDRHEHIGQGQIGLKGMRRIVNHPRLKSLPMILETPEVETMIETNLATVRQLQHPPRAMPKRTKPVHAVVQP